MLKLVLNKKTGFIGSGQVSIDDHKNLLFYEFDFGASPGRFNLPRGTYYIYKGYFKKILKPVNFKKFHLPPHEYSNRPRRVKWNIIFCNNPNKCSIDFEKKRLLIDYSLKAAPRVVFDFIMAHELGHTFYKTQKFADLCAINTMIDEGYNPSQLVAVPNQALSDFSINRKIYILNKFKKR